MINKYIVVQSMILTALAMSFLPIGCSTDGNAPGGSSVSIPQVTGPVAGAATSSTLRSMATTGVSLNATSCSGCNSATNMSQVWSMAQIFVYQGMVADLITCIIQALVKSNVVPTLTSGNYVNMYTSDSKLKVAVTLAGTTLKSFELFGCNGGSQTQYLKGSQDGSDVTFSGRISAQGIFVTMDATGSVDSGSGGWLSKTLTVGSYSSSGSPSYSQFTMTQNASSLDLTGVLDQGTLGTQDTTDVRFVARAGLIGNSVRTYALGDGSVRIATGNNSASQVNWNGDSKVEGGGPTTYDSAVASATLPTVPSTRTTGFATSEQWDCSQSADAVNVEQLGMSSPTLVSDLSTCIGAFQ